MNQVRPLTENDLRTLAPSVFATSPVDDVSERYRFIPTFEVVKRLQTEGWFPTKAQEYRVTNAKNQGYQKHLIRFQRHDLILNGEAIEVVLINSHNRSAAYQLMAGVFRFICSNGMIVGDTFEKISVRHMDFDPDEIVEASYEIINNAPKIARNMQEMKAIELSQSEREIFAESAALVLYDEKVSIPFRTERLLTPRRYDDRGKSDLWSTFNIVQENVMKGGIRGLKKDDSGNLRSVTTRKIKSIDRDIKLNKALWNLTEKMKGLKTS
jgi:hypothetical protein